jgi:hypothetical protein
MNKTFLKSILRTVLALLMLVGGMRTIVSAQSVNARHNRIVGLWDVQVTVFNCSTGVPLSNFRAVHKYELGGTGQVVPATNPAVLSAHMSIWSYVQQNDYRLAFKMFRFDPAGNSIGWIIVKNNVAINEDATEYAGSGQAEIFDSNGNSVGTTCPTFTGTRFSIEKRESAVE